MLEQVPDSQPILVYILFIWSSKRQYVAYQCAVLASRKCPAVIFLAWLKVECLALVRAFAGDC